MRQVDVLITRTEVLSNGEAFSEDTIGYYVPTSNVLERAKDQIEAPSNSFNR